MKNRKLLSLISVIPLVSCVGYSHKFSETYYFFNTAVTVSIKAAPKSVLYDVENILSNMDYLADRYHPRVYTNAYSLNQTNESTFVWDELYDMLYKACNVKNEGATYFSPLCGALSDLWKESLAVFSTPDAESIEAELNKINTSSIAFHEFNEVQRVGDALIDLGGIAKGYALDLVKEYFELHDVSYYLVNAGSSSILLGEKGPNNESYVIDINDLPGAYIKAKNCFISTSSKSVQGVMISGVIYSHIVNPVTGSAVNENDAVIVISDKGYLGDALSTSMMMNTVAEIQAIEIEQNVKTIVIKNGMVLYKNPGLEIYHH